MSPEVRGSRLLAVVAPRRHLIAAVADGLAWPVALAWACWLRYEFSWSRVDEGGLLVLAVLAAAVQLGLGRWQGLYSGRWRFGSFEEVATLVGTAAVTTLLAFGVNLAVDPHLVPRGAVLTAGVVALVLMGALRYGWRLFLESVHRSALERSRRAVIYGAGDAAHRLVRSMVTSPDSPLLPVAVVDDAARMQGHRLARGVKVEGRGQDLPAVAAAHGAEVVILAIPSADNDLVRRTVELGEAAGLEVLILPALYELTSPHVGVADVREVTMADLLGRHELDLDVPRIAHYLTGRRVLVTGAGGSIGSELCRQISWFSPATLVMLDRDESALHALQLSLDDEARLDDERLVVADIRDPERIRGVFADFRPEVVFHAAALKHVPLLELHPAEALKTNVFGTRHVLDAAQASGVDRFINVSTDKAADPVNVLGRTKLLAERMTAGVAHGADGTYLSVRFGNVLGSRGSVLSTFQHQLDRGGPITVTHPDVTRYFMTVEESVQLVIQAGAIGEDGDVLVLDMGEPVRIADVAQRMAESVEPPVPVEFTGLRPGEKLVEVLFGVGEEPKPTDHHLVHRVSGQPVNPFGLGQDWPYDDEAGEVLLAILWDLEQPDDERHAAR